MIPNNIKWPIANKNNVLSNKNKEFLWNVLYDNKSFDSIPNTNLDSIKRVFEQTIINVINTENSEKLNLLDINKKILEEISSKINEYRIDMLKSSNVKNELQHQKVLIFDKSLEEKKESFDDLISAKKPKEINFSDNIDNPIENTEMNRMLELMQKERNNDILILKGDISNNIINSKNIQENMVNKKLEENFEENVVNDVIIGVLDNTIDHLVKEVENKEEKHKIKSIEDLLNINSDSADSVDDNSTISNSNITEKKVHFSTDDLQRRNSKVLRKDINNLINTDYNHENLMNSNMRFNEILRVLNKVLDNQNIIMKKLEISSEIPSDL
tara:strand:- start:3450 stop:4433 length:984 start_codon:yes stop_codon:yes gene_type:complete